MEFKISSIQQQLKTKVHKFFSILATVREEGAPRGGSRGGSRIGLLDGEGSWRTREPKGPVNQEAS